jgi:hypothetical protein
LAKTFLASDESKNFQKAVAGESELRGKTYTEYHSSQGLKKYKYLYNQDTVSKAVGQPCFYILTATTYPGLTVDQATTASLDRFAGVHAESVTSGAWGWVQIEGYHSAVWTRKYGSASNKNMTAGSYLGPGINAIDALPTCASAECEPDSAFQAANNLGYAVNIASCASHSDQSTTTTTQACLIFGLVR